MLAYSVFLLIGMLLGLIGGGGSILTVPVLVYLFGTSPLLATSYSLFIVGSTSLVGAYNSYRKGCVRITTALLFGASSILTVFLTRKFVIPVLPRYFGRIGTFEVTADLMTLFLFAVLMILSAAAMIRKGITKGSHQTEKSTVSVPGMLMYGISVGLATGILGAGGGFLIIPALVLLVGLPMKEAVGTSLLIIALNSLIGFTGDLGHFKIAWLFLLTITAIAIAGVFIGGLLSKMIDGERLRKVFGWFVLAMGSYIIIKEILLKF